MHSKLLLLTAAFAAIASVAVHAEDKGAGAVSQAELRAKTDYCKTCHGVSGQGFRGSVPMPRLAGQQPEYLKNQLQAFIDRRRTNPVMFNVAHVLSPPMLEGLSTYFKNLDPKPLGGAPKELVADGKKDLRGRHLPAPRFRPARPVTDRSQRRATLFLVWRASSTTTSTGS